jgi:ribonuclease Y
MGIDLIIVIVLAVVAAGGAYLVGSKGNKKDSGAIVRQAEELATKMIDDARREADTITKEAELKAKDAALEAKAGHEREITEKRKDLQNLEKRLLQKEDNLDKKVALFDQKELDILKKEQGLATKEQSIAQQEADLKMAADVQKAKLESISGMSASEAKKELMTAMEDEAKHDAAKLIKQIEEEARETADKKAKEIMALAIQRYAGEYVAERTVSVVPLPSDEMKGRIIGREGRNIRALEAATGIDLIIDDTPEAVILSGFNPVRREVARLSLEKLLADGRIHPGRIEEVVTKSEEEVDKAIKEAGEQAAFDLGVHGIHPEVLKTSTSTPWRSPFSAVSWPPSWGSTSSRPNAPVSCTTWARRSTMKWKGPTPSSAPNWPANTASPPRLSTPSWLTMRMKSRTRCSPSWFRPPMPSPAPAPALAAR